jgi:hypothetical protein
MIMSFVKPSAVITIAILFASTLFRCSHNTIASTGGTDFPNTKTVEGIVTSSSGAPIAGATIHFVRNASWPARTLHNQNVAIDSTKSDSKGNFFFKCPAETSWNIQIDSKTEGLLTRNCDHIIDSLKDTIYSFSCKPYASVSGSVLCDSGYPQQLRLSGSLYTIPVSEGSYYSSRTIAEGDYSVFSDVTIHDTVRTAFISSMSLKAGSTQPANVLQSFGNQVHIDDFTVGLMQTDLGRLTGGSSWYTVDDNNEGGYSSIKMSVVSGSESFSGPSLSITSIIGSDNIWNAWTIAGFSLGRNTVQNAMDLSKLTSLSFMAKGQGKTEVRFYSRLMDSISGTSENQFSYIMSIPSAWTRTNIFTDSLQAPYAASKNGIAWARAAKSIYAITFIAKCPENNLGDTIVLWLDNVELDGMDINDVIP